MASETLAPVPQKSRFSTDVLKLVGGSTVVQLLGMAAAPILARLFGPEAIGILGLFTALINIVGSVACWRYELSIVLPAEDEEGANLFAVSLLFGSLTALLAAAVVWLGGAQIATLLNAPKLIPFLWLIPLMLWASGFFLSLTYWSLRTKHFGRISTTNAANSVMLTGGKVGAGLAGFIGGGSLILATVAAKMVTTLVLGMRVWRSDRALLLDSIRWRAIWAGAKRHYKFPIYNAWSTLLNNFSWQLPAFMLAAYFSPAIVGFYGLGNRLVQMPINLIGGSIAQVFFQRTAASLEDGTLAAIVENVLRALILVGLFPLLTLSIIGSDLFTLVLGARWAEAGVYAQILAVWTFVFFLSAPLSQLFSVLEKQQWAARLHVINLITRFASLAIGGYLGSVRLALALFALSGVLVYGYMGVFIVRAAGVPLRNVARMLARQFGLFVPAGVILLSLQYADAPPLWTVGVATLLTLIYFAYAIGTDLRLRRLLLEMLPTRRALP